MPTHGRPAFAARAAAAFLAQDHAPRELIVVDDGPELVPLPDDDRIVSIRLAQRATIGAKRNIACEAARGDVIAHWDDDDWYAPWRLSVQLARLEGTNADVSGLATLLYWEPAARRAWRYRWPRDARPWLHDATLMYRRELWQREPQPHTDHALDCTFLWGGASKRLVAVEDEQVYVGTIHPGNTSAKDTSGPLWSPYPETAVRALMRCRASGGCARQPRAP
jgi:glycosyltransferase involved in cell wall biosynthesis